MSKIVNGSGTEQAKTDVMSVMTDVTPTQNQLFRFDGTTTYIRKFTHPGEATFEKDTAIAFIPGQTYTQAEIDLMFPAATVDSITPATGAAAGGTAVVIKGSNLGGVTGVTFGGTAGTSLSVVSDTEVHVTTPAKTAGTYDVVVTDDSGSVTKTGAFVYT